MKKLFLLMSIAIALCVGVLAYNPNFWPGYKGGADQFQVKLNIEKGWNLIPVFNPISDIVPESQIKDSDILAVYVYSPKDNAYLEVHPENKAASFLASGSRISASTYVSAWVYSKNEGELLFKADNRLYHLTAMEIPLDDKGWHFIAKTPDVIKAHEYDTTITFDSIIGDCDIERVYLWDSTNQEWKRPYKSAENVNDIYAGQMGGVSDQHIYSYLVKINNPCTFGGGGKKTGTPISPPSLPPQDNPI